MLLRTSCGFRSKGWAKLSTTSTCFLEEDIFFLLSGKERDWFNVRHLFPSAKGFNGVMINIWYSILMDPSLFYVSKFLYFFYDRSTKKWCRCLEGCTQVCTEAQLGKEIGINSSSYHKKSSSATFEKPKIFGKQSSVLSGPQSHPCRPAYEAFNEHGAQEPPSSLITCPGTPGDWREKQSHRLHLTTTSVMEKLWSGAWQIWAQIQGRVFHIQECLRFFGSFCFFVFVLPIK